jgi:hypothetical protein
VNATEKRSSLQYFSIYGEQIAANNGGTAGVMNFSGFVKADVELFA